MFFKIPVLKIPQHSRAAAWPTEKILGFEWPKTVQMPLNIFKCAQDCLVRHNNFCKIFSFYKDFLMKI